MSDFSLSSGYMRGPEYSFILTTANVHSFPGLSSITLPTSLRWRSQPWLEKKKDEEKKEMKKKKQKTFKANFLGDLFFQVKLY